MSLRWRLTLVIGGVVAVMLFGASFLAYISAERELNSQVDEFLRTRSRETEVGLQTFANPPAAANLEFFTDVNPAFQQLFDVNPELQELFEGGVQGGFQGGTLDSLSRADASIQLLPPQSSRAFPISGSQLPLAQEDFEIAARTGDETITRALFDRVIENGETYRVLVSSNPQGALMVGRPLGDVTQTLEGLRGWLLAISVVGSLGAAFVGWIVADRVLRPVTRLAIATEQVAETRRFDADLRVESSDELGALARSFNSMLSALRASREQQERLVRDANHELRTPLTSLRTNVDVLRRRGELMNDEQRLGVLDEMKGEVLELTDLVNELVTSATGTGALTPESFTDIDLQGICAEAAERTHRRTGRAIQVHGDSMIVRGDRRALERAVGNLIGNAVKFSPADSPIEIYVRGGGVFVCDRGPGIPEEDRDRVFDRFYRSDATRTMPGSGLGLAMVSEIAVAHGGETCIEGRVGGGVCVGMRLNL